MIHQLINTTWHNVVDLLLPPACVGCQTPLIESERSLCQSCSTDLIEAIGKDYCRRCGADLPPFGGSAEGCGQCRMERRKTTAVVRVAAYEGPMGKWIRGLKYSQRDALQFILAEELAQALRAAPWWDDVEVLTFVPTCWQHQLFRRVHVATLLAPLVAERLSVPLVPLLQRIRGGPHQVGLPKTQRLTNIRGKFRLARGTTLNQTRLCLIDDVTTTGATLNECAWQLLGAGAIRVYCGVLAKAGTASHLA